MGRMTSRINQRACLAIKSTACFRPATLPVRRKRRVPYVTRDGASYKRALLNFVKNRLLVTLPVRPFEGVLCDRA
jgi:hypothetical protein